MSYYSRDKYYEDECSGPRPLPLGEESQQPKMIECLYEPIRESPPTCLKWGHTLSILLEDPEGLELFKKYVETEGAIHTDQLNFYFACEGLKQQTDPAKIKQMIGAIYKFLRKSQIQITEEVRRVVRNGIKNDSLLETNVYDYMQQDVKRIINDTTYRNFLSSEIYINHVHNIQSSIGGSGIQPSTSSSSGSGSVSVPDNLLSRSSTLPTLHEDSELTIGPEYSEQTKGSKTPATDGPPRLTLESLLATQNRRLKVTPAGAHGYTYTNYSSYNPVSRQPSERQSVSSGKTGSDTMSMSGSSIVDMNRDGCVRQHEQRRQKQRLIAPPNILPNTDGLPFPARTTSDFHKRAAPLDVDCLMNKLNKLKVEQEFNDDFYKRWRDVSSNKVNKRDNQTEHSVFNLKGPSTMEMPGPSKCKAIVDVFREKFPLEEDQSNQTDQSILDQHVNRVWSDSPPFTPGSMSPRTLFNSRKKPLHIPPQHLQHEINRSFNDHRYGDSVSSSGHMRHSKSMPDHNMGKQLLSDKWPSMNTDSGISLVSADMTPKGNLPRPSSRSMTSEMTAYNLEEASRRLEDETKRSKSIYKMQQQQKQQISSAPLFQQSNPQEFSTCIITFCDEALPYRIKIPSNRPTLKQFKELLPKKGNYRYFFKTTCEDPDSPVIQEEIVNDTDILPLFEEKIMAVAKPY